MPGRKKSVVYRPSKRRNPLKQRWFWDLSLILLLIIGAGLFFLKTPYFEIKEIEIKSPPQFKEGILKIASCEKNFFLFNKGKIINEIKKEIPEIQEVMIEKRFPSTVIIEAKERKIFGIFCEENEKKCFLMSEDGIIFRKREKEDGVWFFDKRGKKVKIGEEGLEKKKVEQIFFLRKELSAFKINILKVEIFPLEIRVFTNKNFWIYFTSENLENQVKTFLFVYQKEIPEKDKEEMQYIDLRLLENGKKGPVYWK